MLHNVVLVVDSLVVLVEGPEEVRRSREVVGEGMLRSLAASEAVGHSFLEVAGPNCLAEVVASDLEEGIRHIGLAEADRNSLVGSLGVGVGRRIVVGILDGKL